MKKITLKTSAAFNRRFKNLTSPVTFGRGFLVNALVLACFALLPVAQAVVPAPDGNYPGGNTAEGQNALLSRTTGVYNTAVGIYSVLSLTDGSFCTGVGAGTLLSNTADENTATGAGALLSNTTGIGNTATGTFALFSNGGVPASPQGAVASFNCAFGGHALLLNTSGGGNSAMGYDAMASNDTGNFNTANGFEALFSNTASSLNTAVGFDALAGHTTGDNNTAVGALALQFDMEGNSNTAIGAFTLRNNTIGVNNTAVGFNALDSNTEGLANTAHGGGALFSNTSGGFNTAVGVQALSNNTEGGANIALGANAGGNLTTGNNNIDIGNNGVAGESSTIRIGSQFQTKTFIAGIRGATTGINDAINVVIDSNGQLGTMSSSRRFKHEIKPMDNASEAIHALKPVTFHYKSDASGTPQFGLIAEEVAEVNPDLVVRDKNGEIYTVRYDQVNAMLLNEFLKEHRKVQQQEATIGELRADFRATVAQLTARLEAQEAQLQKVNAQLEASKPTPQVVANNQ